MIRFALPYADPYLFPLVAVLASVGIVMVYRIEPAGPPAGAVDGARTGAVLRHDRALRHRGVGVLERYRYTIAAVGIGMTVLPRVPVIGEQVNGAYLDIHVGSISFQPAELGKVAIVIFLASYLRDNRQILVTAGRRVLGLTIPPMKQFGPMLMVWGAAMATLLLTRELGTSLMFFGAFLALLYVATGRLSFPLIGLVLFALGAWFLAAHVGHVHARVLAWEHPFDNALYHREAAAATSSPSRCSRRPTAACSAPASTSRCCAIVRTASPILPVPESDSIYAVIVDELGLVGAAALLLVYLLFVARGLKTAMLARDSFSKLLATGLSFVIAMQVFVIVGGVTRVIPLTGVTLPFVAYGGSSVVMNFVLLALLLVVSDRARRPYRAPRAPDVRAGALRDRAVETARQMLASSTRIPPATQVPHAGFAMLLDHASCTVRGFGDAPRSARGVLARRRGCTAARGWSACAGRSPRTVRAALPADRLAQDGSSPTTRRCCAWPTTPAGDVAPGRFLPAAERYGLIRDIDRMVARAGRHAARGSMARAVGLSIAINLSALSVTDPTMLAHLERVWRRHGVEPSQLVIEVTETAAISDMERASAFCAGVRRSAAGSRSMTSAPASAPSSTSSTSRSAT